MDESAAPHTMPVPDSPPIDFARYFAEVVRTAMEVEMSAEAVRKLGKQFAWAWPVACEELVAAAFLECLQARAAGWEETPPKLFTEDGVLRAVDRVRHRITYDARRIRDNETPVRMDKVDPAPPPDEVAAAADEYARLVPALKELDSFDALVVQRRLEGVTFREIADQVGMTTSAVRTQFSRIRDRLAMRLKRAPR